MAADFRFPAEPVVQVPSPIAIPEYSAWYLRGDIAYGFSEDPDVVQAGTALSGVDMEDTWGFGIGFGYNFSDRVRGDLTLDYRLDADVDGTTGGALHETAVTSTVALANLYFDIKGRDDWTPYVGAGLGFAINQTDERSVGGVPSTGGEDNVALAGAVMAGASYRRENGWMFDAGYRFLYLGDAQTGGTAANPELNFDDIMAHEIRVGVRYEFQ